jgi:heat shock protein HtpX
MSDGRLYLGLWLRMSVALALSTVGLLVLLAAEFVVAAVVSFFMLNLAPALAVALLALAVVFVLPVVLLWVLSLWFDWAELSDLLGRDEDRDIEASDLPWLLTDVPTVGDVARGVGLLVGSAVGLFVVHEAMFALFDTTRPRSWLLWFAAVPGAVLVVVFNGWLVYSELRSGSSVREDIEAEYDIVSDPEREHEVQRRVRRLAEQADSPVPDVEIGGSHLPRAASVGYRPGESVILVSRGLVDTLDGAELDAVLAHELAHLLNRDAAVMTALSVPRSEIGGLFELMLKADDAAILFFPVLVAAMPVYVTNRLAVPMVARYREFVADHAAGELVGSHAAMASALTTLDREYATQYTQDLRVGWSTEAFGIVPPPWEERKVLDGAIRFYRRRVLGTHPPTESRVERLRSRDG